MYKLLLIAVGGAVGTLARYGTTSALARWSERFPWGVLLANALGCFLIGYLQGIFTSVRPMRIEYQLALTVGFLGGYTTFSTYGWETMSFVRAGDWMLAGLNILANNVIGFALVLVGHGLAHAQTR